MGAALKHTCSQLRPRRLQMLSLSTPPDPSQQQQDGTDSTSPTNTLSAHSPTPHLVQPAMTTTIENLVNQFPEFTKEEITSHSRDFLTIDVDEDFMLNMDELRALLEKRGTPKNFLEVKKLISTYGGNRAPNKIHLSEYFEMLRAQQKGKTGAQGNNGTSSKPRSSASAAADPELAKYKEKPELAPFSLRTKLFEQAASSTSSIDPVMEMRAKRQAEMQERKKRLEEEARIKKEQEAIKQKRSQFRSKISTFEAAAEQEVIAKTPSPRSPPPMAQVPVTTGKDRK